MPRPPSGARRPGGAQPVGESSFVGREAARRARGSRPLFRRRLGVSQVDGEDRREDGAYRLIASRVGARRAPCVHARRAGRPLRRRRPPGPHCLRTRLPNPDRRYALSYDAANTAGCPSAIVVILEAGSVDPRCASVGVQPVRLGWLRADLGPSEDPAPRGWIHAVSPPAPRWFAATERRCRMPGQPGPRERKPARSEFLIDDCVAFRR